MTMQILGQEIWASIASLLFNKATCLLFLMIFVILMIIKGSSST